MTRRTVSPAALARAVCEGRCPSRDRAAAASARRARVARVRRVAVSPPATACLSDRDMPGEWSRRSRPRATPLLARRGFQRLAMNLAMDRAMPATSFGGSGSENSRLRRMASARIAARSFSSRS